MELTLAEINELRWAIFNRTSPSKSEASKTLDKWATKLTLKVRELQPSPVQTINVD